MYITPTILQIIFCIHKIKGNNKVPVCTNMALCWTAQVLCTERLAQKRLHETFPYSPLETTKDPRSLNKYRHPTLTIASLGRICKMICSLIASISSNLCHVLSPFKYFLHFLAGKSRVFHTRWQIMIAAIRDVISQRLK